MTAGSPETLVLALGNQLLSDDAVGLHVLEILQPRPGVEYVDGGTKGLELLGVISNRRRLIIVDAVQFGVAPGTIHVLYRDDLVKLRAHRATTGHEGNALELLAVAELTGDLPREIWIVGVEAAELRTNLGLSPAVAAAVAPAAQRVEELLDGR